MSKGQIVKKDESENDGDMPFLDHLEELRWTILKSLGVVLLACILVGVFIVPFNDFLMYPFLEAERNYGQDVPDPRVKSALAPFFVMIEISFFGGLFIALPFVLYYVGKFIAPAFTMRERKVLLPGIITCVVLFSAGVVMSFFWMMPIFFEFSFRVCDTFNWEILYDLEAYYSYVVWMPLACGLSFQMPLILYVLIYLEVVSPDVLRKNRRLAFVIILIISAILTPSDPITLFLLGIPLYALYELALFFGVGSLKKKIAKRKQEEDEFDREGRQMYGNYYGSADGEYKKSLEEVGEEPENFEQKKLENGLDESESTDEKELEKRYSDVDFRAEETSQPSSETQPFSAEENSDFKLDNEPVVNEEDDPRIVDCADLPSESQTLSEPVPNTNSASVQIERLSSVASTSSEFLEDVSDDVSVEKNSENANLNAQLDFDCELGFSKDVPTSEDSAQNPDKDGGKNGENP